MDTDAKLALDTVTAPLRATPQRLGAMLGEARAAAGLDLIDISRESRIPLRHLRAIESDSHDALPALPYTIGFVKSFARAVGRDPEAAALQFRAETTKVPIVPMMAAIEPLDERRLPPRGLMTLSIVGVLAVVGGLVAYSAGMFDRSHPASPVLAATSMATPLAPTAIAAAPAAIAAGPAPALTQPVVAAAVPLPDSASGPALANSVQPVAMATAAGPVTITPSEDVWVKIYDRANRSAVKIGILPANIAYAVPATPGLLLWTGKAGVLKVSVGGHAIPPLGKAVETVRDVSLAAADLLARAAAAPPAAVAAR